MNETRPLIVHSIHHLVIGGTENGLVNLINRLPADRYRHAIVCADDYSDFRQRIRDPDVAVYAMHKHDLGQGQLYRKLFRLFRTLRPDVVHTRGMSGLDSLLPAMLAGVSVRVHGEHGWDVNDIEGRNWRQRRLRRLHRPLVSHYVCVSKHLERYLVERVAVTPEKITQIYNGVDTLRFAPRGDGVRPLAALWGDGSRFIVGTVGRLQPVKNQRTLIEGVAALVDRHPNLRSQIGVAIIGDGAERQRLEEGVRAAGLQDLVKFLGARDDVADLLPDLDLFVLPSLAEGISNTILEAMASGVATIATRVGGNPELIEDGLTGRLVPPGDSEAIAQGIFDHFTDHEMVRRHGRSARQAAVQRFSLERMIDSYASLYDGLLERRTHSPMRASASS